MVQTSNRFFDEMARLMNDAAGAAQGMRREVETLFRAQAERLMRDLDEQQEVPLSDGVGVLGGVGVDAFRRGVRQRGVDRAERGRQGRRKRLARRAAERLMRELDVVTREEFEAVKEMARLAREENEDLKARMAALEARLKP